MSDLDHYYASLACNKTCCYAPADPAYDDIYDPYDKFTGITVLDKSDLRIVAIDNDGQIASIYEYHRSLMPGDIEDIKCFAYDFGFKLYPENHTENRLFTNLSFQLEMTWCNDQWYKIASVTPDIIYYEGPDDGNALPTGTCACGTYLFDKTKVCRECALHHYSDQFVCASEGNLHTRTSPIKAIVAAR